MEALTSVTPASPSSMVETLAKAVGAPVLVALKSRQQTTWASGDYSVIGTTLQIIGELLCEAADLHAGWKVLDVAAGNGTHRSPRLAEAVPSHRQIMSKRYSTEDADAPTPTATTLTSR
jgi:hypothetical protein